MTSQPLFASPEIALPLAALTAPAAGLHLQIVLNESTGINSQEPLLTLLPAPQLVEILTVGIGQIVPIFSLPPWVMGVYNWRGQVLWIVDLNHLMGLTPWYEQPDYGSKHTIVVLRETGESKEKAIVGLAVSRVEDMVECTADSLHSLHSLYLGHSRRSRHSRHSQHSPAEPNGTSALASNALGPDASAPDALSNALADALPDSVPASLHRFLLGYWDSNAAEERGKQPMPRHWLLNGSAILQSLSELPT